MDNQRGLTIVLWVIVLFGIFFLARGLTGKAVLDLTTSDQCVSDNLCSDGKICCYGMCYTPNVCSQLSSSILEKPQQEKNYLVDIGFGLLILMAVLIAFYGIHNRKNGDEKIRKVSKGKRKKKR